MKLTIEQAKERMTATGDLNLSGCTSLTALPEGLSVGGRIYR